MPWSVRPVHPAAVVRGSHVTPSTLHHTSRRTPHPPLPPATTSTLSDSTLKSLRYVCAVDKVRATELWPARAAHPAFAVAMTQSRPLLLLQTSLLPSRPLHAPPITHNLLLCAAAECECHGDQAACRVTRLACPQSPTLAAEHAASLTAHTSLSVAEPSKSPPERLDRSCRRRKAVPGAGAKPPRTNSLPSNCTIACPNRAGRVKLSAHSTATGVHTWPTLSARVPPSPAIVRLKLRCHVSRRPRISAGRGSNNPST